MFLFLGPGEIMLKFTCCRLNQFVLILNTTEIEAVWNFKMLVDNTCWPSVCVLKSYNLEHSVIQFFSGNCIA
jgi:hypothetical protein